MSEPSGATLTKRTPFELDYWKGLFLKQQTYVLIGVFVGFYLIIKKVRK